MKSIKARLETLEAVAGMKSLVLLVTLGDGSEKEMGVAEYRELMAGQRPGYGFSCRIISGDNLRELDEYLDIININLADIANNPVPNRNIEDYE